MGRRKTKNKWSYENYTVLHQLGPDILIYEIQAKGGSTRIVHSLGQSPGYTPLEVDMIPKESMRMLEVVDTHGLEYAYPQTKPDLVTPRLPDLEEGHVSLVKCTRTMRRLVH